jgi:hypothetical protein
MRRIAIVLLLALPPALPAASIGVYIAAPRTTASIVGGSTTENFNSLVAGNRTGPFISTIGTYQASPSSPFAVVDANVYGGALGTGEYFAIGAQSGTSAPVTLNLAAQESYFGLYMSAIDANSGLSFYLAGVLLVRFTGNDIVSVLSGNGRLTAIDGTRYPKANYFGNPDLGGNTAEPYPYVMFFGNGVKFDRVVFDNSNSTGSGFESDNHSIHATATAPPGTAVFVENLTSPALTAIPEPSTWAMAISGMGLFLLGLLRQRRIARIGDPNPSGASLGR